MNNYTAKDLKSLSVIEGLRTRPHMYIGSTGIDGVHHCIKEIVTNSVDEALNGYGKTIQIEVENNIVRVKDNGRGIPFDKMEDGSIAIIAVVTKMHAGGKFENNNYSVSGGMNGCGATAVNALADNFKIVSVRDGEECTVTFQKGELQNFVVNKTNRKDKGTTVEFELDKTIFSTITPDLDRLHQEIKELSYLTSGIEFDLNGTKYLAKDGIKEMLKDIVEKPITKPVYIKEEIDLYDVEIAFQYTESISETVYSYVNNIPTKEGGTHITGFRSAYTTQLNSIAKEMKLITDSLDGTLLRKGMTLIIAVKMRKTPEFASQTKDKLITVDARTKVSAVVTKRLSKSISKADLEVIVKKALVERKAEEAAQRKREAEKRISSGGKVSFKDLPDKFSDAIQKGGDVELFLVEGDSAAGSAKEARNKHTQAIFPLKGKPLNTYSKELADIIKNEEIKNILSILGCGIGEKLNLRNLRYNKIILMSDADPDGGHINVLLTALFMVHLPELIREGKVYCAVPPLYKVTKGTKVHYTSDRREVEGLSKDSMVTRLKGLGEMGPEELWESTMNPETRELVQLTPDNFEAMMDLFAILMGSDSSARKQFIMENARKYNMFNAEIGDESEVE